MFEWLKIKAENLRIKDYEWQLNSLIKHLENLEGDSLGILVIASTYLRKNFELSGQLPASLLVSGPIKDLKAYELAQNELNKANKLHRKAGNTKMTGPISVWGHSIRSLAHPDLIPLGKALWEQIVRGFPHLEQGVEFCPDIYGFTVDKRIIEEAKFIPVGLEPEPKKKLSKSSSLVSDIVNLVSSRIEKQFLITFKLDNPPDDDFVIGYIGGFCDAILQHNHIDNNSGEGMGVLSMVFSHFYGIEQSSIFVNQIITNDGSSKALSDGLLIGCEDVSHWVKDFENEDKLPKGLARYILGI